MPNPKPRSRGWRALPLLATLVLASCFESPIRESLELRFFSDGNVRVTSTVELSSTSGMKENPALVRRVTEAQRQILAGEDPWTPRFTALNPLAERFSWEKVDGEVLHGVHGAFARNPEDLPSFFADTSLRVSYQVREGTAELVIVPGAAGRATRQQRRALDQFLGSWTAAVAEYMAEVRGLYEYLEERPERAAACLGTLYAERLREEEREDVPAPTREEAERLERISDALGKVASVLVVPEKEEYSLDEVSRLVYDPFPARLTVRLPGEALEIEGFAAGDKTTLTAYGPSLWQALWGLEGRWISPDPLRLYFAADGRERQQPVALGEILRQPRSAGLPPSAREVQDAIESRLQPAPVYRAVWRIQPGADGEDFSWE